MLLPEMIWQIYECTDRILRREGDVGIHLYYGDGRLFGVRDNRDDGVFVFLDLEIEPPAQVYACLPEILCLIHLLGAERRVLTIGE
jgi:hypothetical protein